MGLFQKSARCKFSFEMHCIIIMMFLCDDIESTEALKLHADAAADNGNGNVGRNQSNKA